MSPETAEAIADEILTKGLKDPSGKLALEAAIDKILIEANPFLLILDGHLYIKTKSAELKVLKLNKAQRRVVDIIIKKWGSREIIRLIILKARQLGISTAIEAVIYALTSQLYNINSLIIADDQDGSNYIFEMSKLYHEKCSPVFKPAVKKSNEKKLEFDKIHSQLLIDTSANPEAGRKYTFHVVHLSEYAFFKTAKALMLGLSQAVPALPHTMIIKETTANGFNFFKGEWDAAVNGESDYMAIFIPWFWGEDYRMTVSDDFKIGDPSMGEITADEFMLRDLMIKDAVDLIEERLQWRRWCIRNNCDGKVSGFRQEYPSTDYEAFVASGDTYFDKQKLIKLFERAPSVKSFTANIVEIDNHFELRRDKDGIFTFYEQPAWDGKYEGDYTVAGDCSSGTGLDSSCLEVRRKIDNKQMATYHGKCEPDEMEQYAYLLGNFFNQAVVAIENEKFGFAVNNMLRKRYGNIYKRDIFDLEGNISETKFGWETTSVSRPIMISDLAEDIRQDALEINSKQAVMECFTFVRNPETKKIEAEQGCNDDWVITMAINSALRRLQPYEPVVPQTPGAEPEHRTNRGMGWKK